MQSFDLRRRRLLEKIDGVMVLCSAPIALRNNDVEHEYRQDSDLYYLTGFTEPESVLVLAKAHPQHKVVLFVRSRDPEREVWDGARAGVDGAVAQFGADAAFPIAELAQRLPEYLKGHERLYYPLGRDAALDALVLAAIARVRGRGRAPEAWPRAIVEPTIVHEMRLRKAPDEIAAMQRASDITGDAHVRAMGAAAPGRYEYELEAVLRETFRRSGAERTAYSPIVGSGPNATILHYRKNAREMREGELVLIDAGCEYGYYASDVTRTFPVGGTFSPAQRKVYEVVLAAQRAAIEAVRPGANIDAVHDLCVRHLVEGMIAIGLLAGERDRLIADNAYRRYYMHRTSHWLGMDVHDVGNYYVDGKPRPFEPGMVITVEPGIYVSGEDTAAPPEYRGIGVRIEDDVLVTADGSLELTRAIPKDTADVERACRRG